MKVTLLAAVIAVALDGHAIADDQSEIWEMATNNLSHEMSECAAFNKVVAACLFRSNMKKESEQARKSGVAYLEWAAYFAKEAGISKLDEVLSARDNMAVKSLRELIDDDCRNISIPLDKYGRRCKAIYDHPDDALKEYIAQAKQRISK
jgi:hypothetical protein